MFAWQFQHSAFQRCHHRFTRFVQIERRLLRLLVFFAASFIAILSLDGCLLTPQRPSTEALLYLGWDDLGREQLFVRYPDEKPRQLTSFATGVRDYAPSPDGHHIALSTISDDGDSELWVMEHDGSSQTILYSCVQAECSNMVWAPDSRRLLFEQRKIGGDGSAGIPILWWLDTQSANVLPLHEDDGQHGAFGAISPDGQWLSYHSPEKEGLYIYNLENGSSQFVTNEIGTEAGWSPHSQQLVLPQLDLVIVHGEEGEDHDTHEHDYQTAVHLLRLDVNTGEQHSLSGDIAAEDSVPAWSPDGEWIAFGRRAPGTGAARQLWIMRSDGTEPRALTDDPSTNHGPPNWSTDGRYLLFQQIPQDDLASTPGIWRIDVETGEKEQLVPAGMQPTWLPPSA